MSRLDDLPPDQKAALSLLLRRRQSYADLAAVLNISERSVHDRAHAGLAMLAPAQARALSAQERERIGDFVLGQNQDGEARAGALLILESSPDARAWAHALVDELTPIGDGALPALPAAEPVPAPASASAQAPKAPPAGAQAAAEPPPAGDSDGAGHEPAAAAFGTAPAREPTAARPTLPVSRPAGAALLAVLIAGVVLAVVLIPSGGGSSKPSAASTTAPPPRGEAASTNGKQPTVTKRIVLRPVEPTSSALGVALVLAEGTRYGIGAETQKLPPSTGFFYALWLYNSPTSYEALGRAPQVGTDGRMRAATLLPSDAANYHRLIVTRETNEGTTRPGPIVLSGTFSLR